MKKLSNYFGESLTLTQPSIFRREFELRSKSELIAKMFYPKFFSTTAVIKGFEEKIEVKIPSIWRSDIEIYNTRYQMPFAKYTSTDFWRTKGMIELPRGGRVYLKFGTFKKSCEIYSSSNQLLVLFQNKFSFKDKNVITIEQKSELLDEYPWIIMVAWYRILQKQRKNST